MEKANKRTNLSTLEVRKDLVRSEKLNGRDFLVSPVVPLREGVHNSELIEYEEIVAFPDAWSGRPLPIDHPTDDNGMPVTAGSPKVMEESVIGFLFNVVARDDLRGISGEIWVDIDKAATVPGGLEVLTRLQEGGQLEVSTAYFTFVENVRGEWRGPTGEVEKYVRIQTSIRPDHLALLPFATGACNWRDGCGAPRINTTDDQVVNSKGVGESMPKNSDLQVNGKQLGTALSKAIAAHSGEEGSETIITRLSTAAGIDTAKINALIAGDLDFVPRYWLTVFAAVLDVDPWDIYMAASNDNANVRFNQKSEGDGKISSEPAKALVTIPHNENETGTCEPCQKSLKGKVQEILKSLIRGTEDSKEMEANEKKAKIDGLIASEKTNFTENCRAWLSTLTDEQLAALEPKVEQVAEPVANTEKAIPAAAETPAETPAAQPAKVVITIEQVLEVLGMSEEDVAATKRINEQRRTARNEKITQIAALQNCPYEKAELEAFSDAALDKTLGMLQPEGSPFRTAPGVQRAESGVPAPPAILLRKPGVKGVDYAIPATQPRGKN